MRWWSWRKRRQARLELQEARLCNRITQEVVSTILAEVGEPVLRRTLETLKRNRRRRAHSDYTSLGRVWIAAKRRFDKERREAK